MHPEFDKSLTECNMIRAVEIKNDKPVVTLAVPFLHVPIKNDLIQIIKSKVKNKTGLEAEVEIKEMNEEGKKGLEK